MANTLNNLGLEQVQNVARGMGIDPEGMTKEAIIEAIGAQNGTGPAKAAGKTTKAAKAPAAKAAKATKAAKEATPKTPRAKADPNAPATDPAEKVCKTCNVKKEIKNFPTTAPRADGRRRGDECRKCRDERVTAKNGTPAKAAAKKAPATKKAPAAKAAKATKATKEAAAPVAE